jgi:hypothetical protein
LGCHSHGKLKKLQGKIKKFNHFYKEWKHVQVGMDPNKRDKD